VWFDPVRVADALPALSEALASQTGLPARALQECTAAYRRQLLALAAEFAALLAPPPPCVDSPLSTGPRASCWTRGRIQEETHNATTDNPGRRSGGDDASRARNGAPGTHSKPARVPDNGEVGCPIFELGTARMHE